MGRLLCPRHADHAGLTLQGLIVMEAVALIRFMQKDPRIGASRMRAPAQPHLWDIFPPRLDGRILSPDEYKTDLGRGPLIQVFA